MRRGRRFPEILAAAGDVHDRVARDRELAERAAPGAHQHHRVGAVGPERATLSGRLAAADLFETAFRNDHARRNQEEIADELQQNVAARDA